MSTIIWFLISRKCNEAESSSRTRGAGILAKYLQIQAYKYANTYEENFTDNEFYE